MTTDTKSCPIHAVIGVRRSGDRTLYFRRSLHKSNYRGVWSLPSIKYDPVALPGVPDLDAARALMGRLSRDRLGGAPISVLAHLTSGSSGENPMGVEVTLHLYEVEMHAEPNLNPRFYTDSAWMTPAECKDAMRGQIGGLCTRLWSEYAMRGAAGPRDVGIGGVP